MKRDYLLYPFMWAFIAIIYVAKAGMFILKPVIELISGEKMTFNPFDEDSE